MVVGLLLVDVYIPESNSLKEKRSVLKRLKDRIRNKFNVSVAEIDDHDIWRRAKIGIAHVSSSGKFSTKELQKVASFLESDFQVQVLDYEMRFL